MPKKTTSGHRKSAKKPLTKRTKSPVKSSSKGKKKSFNMVPVYVLSIMVLLCALVIMANHLRNADNKQITKNDKISEPDKKKNNRARTEKKDKDASDANTGKEKNIKKDNTGKEDIADNEDAVQKEFRIYLVRYNSQNEKMSLFPVKRKSKSGSALSGALNELIKGPNKSEKKQGLLTAIPDELKLRSVQVSGKNAVLDFNSAIEDEANGEILLTRIDQLVYTATQFDGIESVVIKVNGKQKKFLGGEGLSVSGPIGRRENK